MKVIHRLDHHHEDVDFVLISQVNQFQENQKPTNLACQSQIDTKPPLS